MITSFTESEALDKILNSGQISHSESQRLGVIRSLFFHNIGRSQTKRDQQVSLPFVDRWRDRWKASAVERHKWFGPLNQEKRTLRSDRDFVLSLIADAPRPGTPAKFTDATKNRIIAIALKKPSDLGIPIEKWSYAILAAYLIEQGIVDTISSTTIGDFLKSAPRKSSQE
jgi:putative transposase